MGDAVPTGAGAGQAEPEGGFAARRPGALRRWAAGHEESWLFTILYVGLAVSLSLFVGLFWLVVLVLVHLLLEWIALEPLHQRTGARLRSAATVSAAARATGKFATLERTVRGILLSLDDAAYVARAILTRVPKARRNAELVRRHAELVAATSRPHRTAIHWTTGDRIAVGILVCTALLLVAAPWLTGQTAAAAVQALGREMRPW